MIAEDLILRRQAKRGKVLAVGFLLNRQAEACKPKKCSSGRARLKTRGVPDLYAEITEDVTRFLPASGFRISRTSFTVAKKVSLAIYQYCAATGTAAIDSE